MNGIARNILETERINSMFLNRATIAFLLVTLFLHLGSKPSTAATSPLRKALETLAAEIKQVVDSNKQSALQVGDFAGSGHPNAGPGISEELKLALNSLSPGLVKDGAMYKLKGEYDQIPDKRDSTLIVLQIIVVVRDGTGQKVAEKFAEVRDTGTIASVGGTTVSLPAKASSSERNVALQIALAKPSFSHQGSVIRATSGSPYGIELLTTSAANAPKTYAGWDQIPARPPVDRDGEAFVDIPRDEVYAIRIHNDSKNDVAVTTTIDGLNVFAFSDIKNDKGQPKYSYFMISPGKQKETREKGYDLKP